MEASISRYTLSTGDNVCFQGGMSMARLVVRVSEDTRMAMSEAELDFNYLTLPSGTFMVLDPPNTLNDDNIWFSLDSAASGVVEVMRS